ncbi:DUF4365 domain-containing protein [Gemmatimonadota bacterium]
MRLPKRPESHIKESDSWKILHAKLPAEWILREVSERDYGIDCYIELVSKNGVVTGELLSGQLKGTEKLSWKKREDIQQCVFSGIKVETVNYWMRLPVPVFLLVADLQQRNLYFCAVKEQVRKKYASYLNQKSISFTLIDTFELGNAIGRVAFEVFYHREKFRDEFVARIKMLLIHWEQYLQFIQNYQELDCFLGAEPEEELLFVQSFSTCKFISEILGIKWELPLLADIYQKDKETFNDGFYRLHYFTFTKILPMLEDSFFNIIQQLRSYIMEKEKDYWFNTEPFLFELVTNLERVKPGYIAS